MMGVETYIRFYYDYSFTNIPAKNESANSDYQSNNDYYQYAFKQTCASTNNNLHELQYTRFLTIPATSMPSEYIFSLVGRIVDDNHTNLDPNTIEAL
ncbi:37117_t:CDS:2, partial [Gigaspora margarita]